MRVGKALTIAIVGAGIGGLVTALVLHRQGHWSAFMRRLGNSALWRWVSICYLRP